MAKTTPWTDDFWLLVLQLYLKHPEGVKPLYSREMVALGMETHVPLEELRRRMEQLERMDKPRLKRFYDRYKGNPSSLSRAVRLLRGMYGFGAAEEFYSGVGVEETFEKDFRPLDEDPRFTPAMLIMVLNLYVQLTPSTMVEQTPEVVETARLIRKQPEEIVEVLQVFALCDPYLNRMDMDPSPLLPACQAVWRRFWGDEWKRLGTTAGEMAVFFKKQ